MKLDAHAMNAIAAVVAEEYGCAVADILGIDRHYGIAEARHVTLYLGRELLGASYPQLGKWCGHRDHTSCIHAVRRIAEKRSLQQAFVDRLARVRARAAAAIDTGVCTPAPITNCTEVVSG